MVIALVLFAEVVHAVLAVVLQVQIPVALGERIRGRERGEREMRERKRFDCSRNRGLYRGM